jgi:hypothetical protein
LLPADSLNGCASLFVGVRDDIAVYSGGCVGGGSCEGDVKGPNDRLMISIFRGAGYDAFHVGIGDSLNVIVFVSDGCQRRSDIVEPCL